MNTEIEYIDKKELAKRIGVSVQTISAYQREGMPIAFKLGKRWPRYDYQKVIEWLQEK